MIEVEKNFVLNDENRKRLIDGAEFLGEKNFTDTYYDDATQSLTGADKWLRRRDDKWELKVGAHHGRGAEVDQYDEIEDEERIREVLGLESEGGMEDFVKAAGYEPFCVATTKREKYRNGDFNIDLDIVTYSDWDEVYETAEIELMVEDGGQKEAAERIEQFARERGIDPTSVRGKIVEYLFYVKPGHYAILPKVKNEG